MAKRKAPERIHGYIVHNETSAKVAVRSRVLWGALEERGQRIQALEEALAAVEQQLVEEKTQHGLARIDVAEWKARWEAVRGQLADLRAQRWVRFGDWFARRVLGRNET